MRYFYLIVTLFVLATGCTSIDYSNRLVKLYLPQKNPTSYVFDFPIGKIKEVLIKNHSRKKHDGYSFNYRPPISNIDSMQYLENEEYFGTRNEYGFNMSRLYVSRDMEPLPNYADYIVWLIPEGSNKTKVKIISYHNEVMLFEPTFNSVASNIISCGNVPLPSTGKTKSSTIEEYEILQLIGEGLGVKEEMPAIVYPDYSNLVIIHKKHDLIYMDQVIKNGKNEQYNIKKRKISKLNPIEYIIDAPADSIKSAFLNQEIKFNKSEFKSTVTYEAESRLKEDGSNNYGFNSNIKFKNNDNDLNLFFMNFNSLVYYTKDKSEKPKSQFYAYLHLEPLSPNKTKVVVDIVLYEVIVYEGDYWNYYLKAEPTTVEEYIILKAIGKHFNMDSMPDIVLPEDVFSYTEKKVNQ